MRRDIGLEAGVVSPAESCAWLYPCRHELRRRAIHIHATVYPWVRHVAHGRQRTVPKVGRTAGGGTGGRGGGRGVNVYGQAYVSRFEGWAR